MERWWCHFFVQTQKIFLKLKIKERRLALQTYFYNKKNNILIIENLENEITRTKKQNFFKGLSRL
jgi:hypothetical protein